MGRHELTNMNNEYPWNILKEIFPGMEINDKIIHLYENAFNGTTLSNRDKSFIIDHYKNKKYIMNIARSWNISTMRVYQKIRESKRKLKKIIEIMDDNGILTLQKTPLSSIIPNYRIVNALYRGGVKTILDYCTEDDILGIRNIGEKSKEYADMLIYKYIKERWSPNDSILEEVFDWYIAHKQIEKDEDISPTK